MPQAGGKLAVKPGLSKGHHFSAMRDQRARWLVVLRHFAGGWTIAGGIWGRAGARPAKRRKNTGKNNIKNVQIFTVAARKLRNIGIGPPNRANAREVEPGGGKPVLGWMWEDLSNPEWPMSTPTLPVENYTKAFLVVTFVQIVTVLVVVWGFWGYSAMLCLAALIHCLISLLAHRLAPDTDATGTSP